MISEKYLYSPLANKIRQIFDERKHLTNKERSEIIEIEIEDGEPWADTEDLTGLAVWWGREGRGQFVCNMINSHMIHYIISAYRHT